MICATAQCESEAFNELVTCSGRTCLCDACAAQIWGIETQRDELGNALREVSNG